ncbi:MAG: hypothetical protein IKW59_00910 [Clostridia bacterium]|nr:hypothetical protein [Clostridia bacterium]
MKKGNKSNSLILFINWIFTHKVKTITLTLLLFLVPICIVHFLFKWNSNIWWIEAEWGAGDIISYIAGFEAFIGTVFLSFLALWQNQKHKEETDAKDRKFTELENEKLRLSNMPQFLIQMCNYEDIVDSRFSLPDEYKNYVPLSQVKTHGFFIQGDSAGWAPPDKIPIIDKEKLPGFFSIINCGNNTAHQVKLKAIVNGNTYNDEKVHSIKKDDEIYLYLSISNEAKLTGDLILQLRFFDCFQNVYEQSFLIKEWENTMLVKSFADIKLIEKSPCMNVTLD